MSAVETPMMMMMMIIIIIIIGPTNRARSVTFFLLDAFTGEWVVALLVALLVVLTGQYGILALEAPDLLHWHVVVLRVTVTVLL